MNDASSPDPYGLLDLVRRLRERERGSLAGWLHDGPIQDLAAVPLILAEARRATGTSSGDALGIVAEQVTQAGRMLRGLQDDLWPFPPSPSGLTQTLNRRTAWLLTAPLTVDAGEGTAGLLETEIVVLADVIELLLGGRFSAAPPDRALAAVRAGQDLIVLDLTMTAAPGAAEASAAELAVAKAAVGRLQRRRRPDRQVRGLAPGRGAAGGGAGRRLLR